jgi:hypothetical protein
MGLTTGARLRAGNSPVEVVVIKAPGGGELSVAGVAMAPDATPGTGADGEAVQLGKRYVDEGDTIEVLCVKPGPGPLLLDGAPLAIKEAKPLPSSD